MASIVASETVLPVTHPPRAGLLGGAIAWRSAIAALAVVQAALIFGHRPWLDEWQALQIALQSPSLAHLLENLRYEGHPPLWYLILRGMAQLVPTFWVLPVTLAGIALVTQGAILAAAPFSRAERLAIAAGELMLFEYMTLSRSLSLGVACVVLAMALRRSRWAWLPIALLPLCDFLFGLLSVALIVLQWRDRRLWVGGLALWLACGAFAAWSVRPAPDMVPALLTYGFGADFSDWITRLGALLVPIQADELGTIAWNGAPPLALGLVFGPLFLAFCWRQTAAVPLHRALLFGFLLATLVFSLTIYPLQTRHLTLAALLLIVLKWREVEQDMQPNRAFGAWLLVGCACSLVVCAISAAMPFDTAASAAREIKARRLQNAPWAVFPESAAQGVSALSGVEFIRLGQECTQSFVRWNRRSRIMTPAGLEANLRGIAARHGRFFLLSSFPLTRLAGGMHGLLRPLAEFPAGYDAQPFNLYVVAADQPDRGWMPPRCAPQRVPLPPAI